MTLLSHSLCTTTTPPSSPLAGEAPVPTPAEPCSEAYDGHDEDVDDDGADDDADDVEDDAGDGGDGGDGDDGDAYDDDGFDDDADAICTALYATRLMRSPAPALQPSDCD